MRTPAGYLVADAFLTRAGVFEYRDAQGKVTRELRHPDDVFHADSLASLKLVPVTNLHPSESVNASTASKHQRGAVGENITRADGDLVAAKVSITDAALIREVESGRQELSCGYSCDVTTEAGEYKGEKYDARQTNIRYDHLAVVPSGRAGRQVRLRMDGAHQIEPSEDDSGDNMSLKKITVAGKEIEVSEVAALVVEQELGKLGAEVAGAKKDAADAKAEADKQKGRADAAESAKTAAEKAHKDATDPVELNKLVQARVELEKIAAKAGVEVKADQDNAAIKRAILAKVQPETKLDDKADAYVDGAFGFVAAALSKKTDAVSLIDAATNPSGEGHKDAAEDAHKAMVKANADAFTNYRKSHGA